KVVYDALGNIYFSTYFADTIDVDPSANTVLLVPTALSDNVVKKVSPAGDLIWAKHFKSTGRDLGGRVFLDDSENLYVTSYFNGTVVFDTNNTALNIPSVATGFEYDSYLAKLDNS